MSVAPSGSISNVVSGAPASTAPTSVLPSESKQSRRKRGKKTNVSNPSRTPASAVSGVPRPQYLSTVETPSRDDPMLIDDFLVSGADELPPISVRPQVAVDNAGFTSLIESVYMQMSMTDRYFSQSVPRPLFTWYCVFCLWYRYVFLSVAFGRSEVDNLTLLERWRSVTFFLPDPIRRYLDGIGEFRTPFGDKFRIRSPPWPTTSTVVGANFSGSFGQLNDATAYMYAGLPSPFVATYNICAAIARTGNIGNWFNDLPVALRPAAPNAGFRWELSENLLGFDNSIQLTTKQVSVLRNLGFGATPSAATFAAGDRFQFNAPALIYVSETIEKFSGYKVSAFTNSSPAGTISIGPYITRTDDVRAGFRYTDLAFEVASSFQTDSRASSAALLMAYRVYRVVNDDGSIPHLPYRYLDSEGKDSPPPGRYTTNLNCLYNSDQATRLNNSWFESKEVVRLDVLSEMVRAFRSQP